MPVIMPVKPFPDKWSLFVKMLSRYILKYVKLAKYTILNWLRQYHSLGSISNTHTII